MKILFICGCLELGQDGVGDYTHRLAECLVDFSHHVVCVAINDRHVAPYFCYSNNPFFQFHDRCQVIRFSSFTDWKLRFEVLRKVIQSCQPDFISLQYVPYSFSTKGLPFLFSFHLIQIRGPWLWHIMFHELWIGRENNLKAYAISLTQEYLIRYASWLLRPTAIHTSIEHYRSMLAKIGIQSALLPLHSSISVFRSNDIQRYNHNSWIFLFFGSLDSQWTPQPFFNLVEAGRKLGRKQSCLFISLGRKGKKGKKLWDGWTSSEVRSQYPAFDFQELGECSVQEVSVWLQRATFGISMAPRQWIGKSSSVAAMIEHGLSVIVPAYQTSSTVLCNDNDTLCDQFLYIDSYLPQNLCLERRFPKRNTADQSAQTLVTSLT